MITYMVNAFFVMTRKPMLLQLAIRYQPVGILNKSLFFGVGHRDEGFTILNPYYLGTYPDD